VLFLAIGGLGILQAAGCCFGINEERVTLELDGQDVQQMAQQMAESLSVSIPPGPVKPVVALYRIRNETNQMLSPVFLPKLRTLLVKFAQDRMTFVLSGRDHAELQAESGITDEPGPANRRDRPTHALLGTFYAHTVENSGGRAEHVLCTFQLVHRSGAIVWEDGYEVKKAVTAELFD